MRHDRNSSGLGKKNKRKDREDKLAASLRENLLRRKSQARARKASGAADKEAEVDLEVKAIVRDTEGATEGDR